MGQQQPSGSEANVDPKQDKTDKTNDKPEAGKGGTTAVATPPSKEEVQKSEDAKTGYDFLTGLGSQINKTTSVVAIDDLPPSIKAVHVAMTSVLASEITEKSIPELRRMTEAWNRILDGNGAGPLSKPKDEDDDEDADKSKAFTAEDVAKSVLVLLKPEFETLGKSTFNPDELVKGLKSGLEGLVEEVGKGFDSTKEQVNKTAKDLDTRLATIEKASGIRQSVPGADSTDAKPEAPATDAATGTQTDKSVDKGPWDGMFNNVRKQAQARFPTS
jgi:hypothetical protein